MSQMSEMVELFESLKEEERLVLMDIARRLKKGESTYGVMNVEGDTRDYFQEAAEEAMDFVVYHAMQKRRRKESPRSNPACEHKASHNGGMGDCMGRRLKLGQDRLFPNDCDPCHAFYRK